MTAQRCLFSVTFSPLPGLAGWIDRWLAEDDIIKSTGRVAEFIVDDD